MRVLDASVKDKLDSKSLSDAAFCAQDGSNSRAASDLRVVPSRMRSDIAHPG